VRALRSHTEREGVLESVCGWVQPQLFSDRAAPRPALAVTEIPLRFYSFHLRFLSISPRAGVNWSLCVHGRTATPGHDGHGDDSAISRCLLCARCTQAAAVGGLAPALLRHRRVGRRRPCGGRRGRRDAGDAAVGAPAAQVKQHIVHPHPCGCRAVCQPSAGVADVRACVRERERERETARARAFVRPAGLICGAAIGRSGCAVLLSLAAEPSCLGEPRSTDESAPRPIDENRPTDKCAPRPN
jgi:hypothetical protein